MLTQPNIIELAKQGNPKAIATLITRSLQSQGITAKASSKGDCLRVMLESKQVPNESASVKFIRQGLTKLEIASIKTVQIYGKQVGKEFPTWIQDFQLVSNSQPITRKASPQKTTKADTVEQDLIPPEHNSQNDQVIQEHEIVELKSPTTIPETKSPHNPYLKYLLSLKTVHQFLVVLFGLRISFDILFAFYSLTWATSFLLINLLNMVDTTGVIAQLLNGLFHLIYSLWSPLELAGIWIYLLSLIAMLVWLHRLHAKLRVLFDGYPITPWKAIARFLIPFYSLWGIWNLFTTLANQLKSESSDLVKLGSLLQSWIPWFYVTLITSNVVDEVYNFQSIGNEGSGIAPWLFVVSNCLNLCFSVIFMRIILLIRKAVIYKSIKVNG